jgi:hypothetical protein
MIDSHNYRVVREDRPTAVGRVYEATHPEQPGRLLLEVLSEAVRSPAALEAFERDMAAVSLLDHPCVLEVLDLGAMPDGTPVVVYKHPDGITLARWLEREREPEPADAVELVTGVADALTAAHGCGVSHGGLTPDQVFLVKDRKGGLGLPKLRGFGQRWLLPEAPAPSAASAGLSAEEIAEDVRALAAIAELLLTPPELREPAEGLAFGTTAPVAAVIRTACAGGDDGFTSPREFAEALAAAIRPEAQPARALIPTTPAPMVSRWRRAPPLAIGAAAGVVVAAVVATGAGLFGVFTPPASAPRPAPVAVVRASAQPAAPVTPPPAPVVVMQPPVRPAPVAVERAPVETSTPRPVASAAAHDDGAQAEQPSTDGPHGRVSFPSIAVVTRVPAVLSVREPRRPTTPLRGVVWSDRERRLVPVDETGAPQPVVPPPVPPPDEPPPAR